MKWLRRLLGVTGSPPPAEFAALLKESREYLEGLTFMHQTTWRLGRHERWNLDTETRTLRFTFLDGEVVDCTAQAVGSYDADHGTWMWAWANQSLTAFPAFLKYAAEVRDYGRRHGLPMLVTPAVKFGPRGSLVDDGVGREALRREGGLLRHPRAASHVPGLRRGEPEQVLRDRGTPGRPGSLNPLWLMAHRQREKSFRPMHRWACSCNSSQKPTAVVGSRGGVVIHLRGPCECGRHGVHSIGEFASHGSRRLSDAYDPAHSIG